MREYDLDFHEFPVELVEVGDSIPIFQRHYSDSGDYTPIHPNAWLFSDSKQLENIGVVRMELSPLEPAFWERRNFWKDPTEMPIPWEPAAVIYFDRRLTFRPELIARVRLHGTSYYAEDSFRNTGESIAYYSDWRSREGERAIPKVFDQEDVAGIEVTFKLTR